ncbi:MAG: LysR family transcriptional regulator [Polyangiaceae bacterium]
MEQAKRLRGIWSYLPTFRFVAEEQHVGRAAKALGLNPSSVSRAIGDLERALGYRVFERRGRSLQLNANGQRLLDVVRAAMRRVDDGVARDVGLSGRVRIAADEPFLTARLPALVQRVRQDHPGVVLTIARAPSGELEKLLLTGAIDVAFGGALRPTRGLTATRIGELRTGLYVGVDHPLASGARWEGELDVVEVRGAPSAASLEPFGLHPRVIALAEDVVVAIGISVATGAASVLPDALVEALGRGRLVRLSLETPPAAVHVLSREDMGGTPRIRAVVATANSAQALH